jgi:hypothetical protein
MNYSAPTTFNITAAPASRPKTSPARSTAA